MGRPVTLTARVRDRAGHVTAATGRLTVPLLVGMDAPNGAEFKASLVDYSGMRYYRDFGKDGDDADTLPEPTAHGTGKLAAIPAGCVVHESWKDDPGLLSGWLDGVNRSYYLTWHHEPHDRVTSAVYQAAGAQISRTIAGHPNGRWIIGHGPTVSRYWLDERGGNPLDWWYPGAAIYGVDCYQNTPTASAYWSAAKMFGVAFGKIRASIPGVRLLVPEYGIVKLNTDSTGAGRAQAMRDHITWLRGQPDVEAVAYFNNMADFPEYAFPSISLEAKAWRDMQAA